MTRGTRIRVVVASVALVALAIVAWMLRSGGASDDARSDGAPAASHTAASLPAPLADGADARRETTTDASATSASMPADTITGFVHDVLGRPIAGVTIEIRTDNDPEESSEVSWRNAGASDAEGAFAIAHLAADTRHVVSLRHERHLPRKLHGVVAPRTLDVLMRAGVPIRGRVTDATTHEPIAGATLSFGRGDEADRSDADGRFACVADPCGLFAYASMEGYLDWCGAPFEPRSDAEVQIELQSAAERVAAEVHVSALAAESDAPLEEISTPAGPVRALGGGVFIVPVNHIGRRAGILLRCPGRAPLDVVVPDGRGLSPQDALEVRFCRVVSLTGSVVDAERRPVPGAEVTLRLADDDPDGRFTWSAAHRRLVSDELGRFVAVGIPADIRITADVRAAGRLDPPRVEFTIGSTDETLPPLVMASPRFIRGFVRDAVTSLPIPGAEVEAHVTTRAFQTARTGTDGSFALVGFDSPATVTAAARDHVPAVFDGVVADSLPPLAVLLAPGLTIAGTVIDASKAPVPGACVRIIRMAAPPGERETQAMIDALRMRGIPVTCADPTGRFRFTGLPRGNYGLVASLADNLRSPQGERVPTVELRSDIEGLELCVTSNSTLAGTVTDATTGAPITRFTVKCEHRSGWSEGPRESSNGRFLEFVRPDVDHAVTVMAPGFAPQRQDGLRVAEGEVRTVQFPMRRECAIDGRLVDPSGAPIAGARIVLDREGASTTDEDASVTNAEGRFRISQLPTGAVRLLAAARFDLVSGGSIRRPLALTPPSVDLAVGQLLTQTFVGRPDGTGVLMLDIDVPDEPGGATWRVILWSDSSSEPIVVETGRTCSARVAPIPAGIWTVGAHCSPDGNVRIGLDLPAASKSFTVAASGETEFHVALPSPPARR